MESHSTHRTLFASDLDGTLIPPERTDDRIGEIARFAGLLDTLPALTLAYVTGRHRALAERGIDECGLPDPDVLICDVGTSLYRRGAGGGMDLDPSYRQIMSERAGGIDSGKVLDLLSGIRGTEPQEEERQAPFKTSLYTPTGTEGQGVATAAAERLSGAGFEMQVVWSEDLVTDRGLLDVLPKGVAKGTALEHLRESMDMAPEGVIYAGDSGNDLQAMMQGYRCIVVGNAPDSLRTALLESGPRRSDPPNHLFFAEAPFAAGVIEGLEHFRTRETSPNP